eukprot:s1705_g3.t1
MILIDSHTHTCIQDVHAVSHSIRASGVGADKVFPPMGTPYLSLDRPGLNGFNGHASLYEAPHLTCWNCGKSMLMDSLFCRHCGAKRREVFWSLAPAPTGTKMTEAQVEVATKEVPSLAAKMCQWLQKPGLQVFLGVVLGLAAGITLAEVHPHENVIKVLSFPGKLWLKALTCVVLPMIMCGMIQSMVMMRELPGARHVAFWVIGLYGVTTVVAAVEGTAVSEFFLTSSIRPLSPADLKVITPDVTKISTLDTILNIFDQLVPKNVVGDAAQNRLISVIMMSILVGLLIPTTRADGRRSSTLELVDEINEVVTKVIKFLIFLSPAGVCSLVLAGSARFNLNDMGTAIVALVGAVIASLGMHMFLFLPTLLALGARRNPVKYFQNCLPPIFTALGASSSAASLPLNIEVAIEKNGLSPHVAKFTLNLGATINMDGTGMYLICSTMCIALLQGITMGPGDLAVLCLMATLCSMGAAPVPSASLVLLATLLSTMNIPVTETFGLITAIDWLLDRLRTCVNVYGQQREGRLHLSLCLKTRAATL